MSSTKKYTSEFYLTVSYIFLLLLLKRNLRNFLFSKAISSQSSNNQNLNKKTCFPNWEIPKNHLLFLGSKNISVQKPSQVRPTSEAPSYEEIEILLDEAGTRDGRDASPLTTPLGVVFQGDNEAEQVEG